jgi:hypothetical protein
VASASLSGRVPSLLHAKSEPLFFDESFKDVVCLQRRPGGGGASGNESHYIYDNEFFVTTKYLWRTTFFTFAASRLLRRVTFYGSDVLTNSGRLQKSEDVVP